MFHDAAREDEGTDHWDHESALLLYAYLRNVLKVDIEKARNIAEATANKDFSDKGYFRIYEDESGACIISMNAMMKIMGRGRWLREKMHVRNHYLFEKRYCHGSGVRPADNNYPSYLQERINQAIDQLKDEVVKEHEDRLFNKLMSGEASILAQHSYQLIMQSPRLQEKLRGIDLSWLFSNLIPEIDFGSLFFYRPIVGTEKIIPMCDRNSYYGTPEIPERIITLKEQIKLLHVLNQDINKGLIKRMSNKPFPCPKLKDLLVEFWQPSGESSVRIRHKRRNNTSFE